jgi:DNA-binding response OmpR family regulator
MGDSLLILEDDSAIQHILKTVLEAEGYRVSTAARGEDALESVESSAPALILMDLTLPDMHGRDFLGKLAAPRPPVLLLTGDYRDPEGASALASDYAVEGCVFKPFVLDDLLREVERLAGRT